MSHRMEFESGSPHRTTQSEYSRSQTKLTGSSTASQQTSRIFEAAAASLNRGNALQKREFGSVLRASESLDLGKLKINEKELLHGLNDRFAGFIEKVRDLEHQNQLLESEIEDIRQKAQSSSSLAQKYEPEIRDLRKQVNDITLQKCQIEIEHQDLEEDVLKLRAEYDQEKRNRSDAESHIIVLKKDIDDTHLAKLQLDKKAQSMVDEIHFLKKNHEIEVSEMLAQIEETQLKVEAHHFDKPDITAALREIRAQLEGQAISDIQQADKCFHAQFAKLNKAAETKREALKATKQEIQEHKRRLQEKNIELDCAKGTREALAKQLDELEDCHNADMVDYQDTIRQLENELSNSKFDMSGHLREHQDLLNVNMALDVEILSFRELLEGEESRLSTISDTYISMPYIYRESPIYTLPCLPQQGGPTRRAEPQKFVEEIITETIRQVEMSEFEETRSEDTVGGEEVYQRKGEEHDKSERGRNEENEDEEEEDKSGLCEEAPEKEDEKEADDPQVETSMEHGGEVSPAESEEGEEGKEEIGDEAEAVERKEDTVKPIQREVKSVDATSDEEKDQLDSQAGAPIDDEISKEPNQSKTEDSLKQSGFKEKKELDMKEESASAEEQHGRKKESPLIESKEVYLKKDITPLLEQTAELESTDLKELKDTDQCPKPVSTATVQEEAVPVLSEETSTDKTTVEVTTEIKTTPTKAFWEPVKSSEDTKAPEIPSTTPEMEEKAHIPTEPKVSSKDESFKTTEEDNVKKTKDERKDENILKESLFPKPDLTDTPEESKDIKKTGAEESIIPDKTTAVAESKDSHSMAPGSNVTQGDKAQEITSTPEREEKAHSLTEPKVISKEESLKTTEEEIPKGSVKITKDETKDDFMKNVKRSETLPEPDLTAAIAKDENIKETNSEDKALAGAEESIIPDKMKMTAVAESKDSHSMALESDATQRDKAPEIPSTTPEKEEKASSPTEPKVISKDESFKTTEEVSVKITKDETKDENNLKESATSPKSDLTDIPKDEEMEKASKSPEKEMSPTEPKVSSNNDSIKTTAEEILKGSVKITKYETMDDIKAVKKMKESETLPKPGLTDIPKAEKIKETSSGDKMMTAAEELIIPDKTKTTAVVESKDSHSVVPESNQTQGHKAYELPSTTPESKEKVPKTPEKEMSLKESKVSSNEDKAMAGAEEFIIPDKTTAVAESKDSHKVTPRSNTTHEKSEEIAKELEKVLDPKDVPTKTESVKTKESEVLIKIQKDATPEQEEISIIKTSPLKAMGLKEKAVDEKKTEEDNFKRKNVFSEDDGVSKDEITGDKTKVQAQPIKELKAEPKSSL